MFETLGCRATAFLMLLTMTVPGGLYCGPTLGAYDAAKLPIRIEPPPTSASVGTVSVTELRHKPKKGALRVMAEGSKLFNAGSHEQAAAQFKKPIAADPEFGLAHDADC